MGRTKNYFFLEKYLPFKADCKLKNQSALYWKYNWKEKRNHNASTPQLNGQKSTCWSIVIVKVVFDIGSSRDFDSLTEKQWELNKFCFQNITDLEMSIFVF